MNNVSGAWKQLSDLAILMSDPENYPPQFLDEEAAEKAIKFLSMIALGLCGTKLSNDGDTCLRYRETAWGKSGKYTRPTCSHHRGI